MICPKCGSHKHVKDLGNSPNGGELFVAEDTGSSTECYDIDIHEFECEPCGVTFYINPK